MTGVSGRPRENPPSALRSAYRVLLVEDNPAEAELVVDQLSNSNPSRFEIAHVTTLDAAIGACNGKTFDCIVMDLQLPDSVGAETIRAMRAQSSAAAIVAFSGVDDERSRERALAHGAQDFVSKNGAEAGSLGRGILLALERWRALRLHRQLEDLLAASPDAIIVLGAEGLVRFANPAACSLFGRGEQDFIGCALDFVVTEDAPPIDIAIESPAGERLGEVRAAGLVWEDAPALLLTVRDVTEQRTLAEQLREAQKMEAIGMFAGGLAHDLGNVLSCVDVLARAARSKRNTRAALTEIARAAESGRAIVRQLLALAGRGDDDSAEAPRVPVAQVLNELHDLLRRTLPAVISLSIDIQSASARAALDRSQLEQVILNLVLNARDAMPAGGRLCIRCGEAPSGAVRLEVSDTGVGIAAENLQRVFDPFFTTKPKGQGSGLGLGVCRAIVTGAGGAITVSSTPGEGAAFVATLPAG